MCCLIQVFFFGLFGRSKTRFIDSVIANSTTEIGGAAYHYTNSVNEFERCRFVNNTSTGNGGEYKQRCIKSCLAFRGFVFFWGGS